LLQASYDKKQLDVGANLFIGNLDPNVDDTLLFNTFSTFGPITTTAKVSLLPFLVTTTDPLTGCKGPTNRRIQGLRLRLVQRL
jgi:RNA recognition motif-containing protein